MTVAAALGLGMARGMTTRGVRAALGTMKRPKAVCPGPAFSRRVSAASLPHRCPLGARSSPESACASFIADLARFLLAGLSPQRLRCVASPSNPESAFMPARGARAGRDGGVPWRGVHRCPRVCASHRRHDPLPIARPVPGRGRGAGKAPPRGFYANLPARRAAPLPAAPCLCSQAGHTKPTGSGAMGLFRRESRGAGTIASRPAPAGLGDSHEITHPQLRQSPTRAA
jgi:hypothetical protein